MKSSRKSKKKISLGILVDWRNPAMILAFSLVTSLALMKSYNATHFLGYFLLCITCISILFMDVFRYKPDYAAKKKMLALLGLLVCGTMIFARAAEYLLENFSKGIGMLPAGTVDYGIPLQSGAMLAVLLFDSHTAIIFSFIISILGGMWQQDASYTFYIFTGSIISAFSVIRCRKRTDIVKAGLYISATNFLTVLVISLFSDRLSASVLLPCLIFALTTGITVTGFVSIVLPVLETVFKVTTDITLLEWLDLNQPLMRNLMINAPGTYHHSVIVGNLVETVAEDIGANPLLARVSAYYHDIGKIKMADYFIENQSSTINKHEKLTPHMSSMILISHVKEGLELAELFQLPEPVRAGICEHHGTNLITYFYQKAKEEQAEPPNEEDYRYPGPKPQSRVTALIMIADSVEAASRVLKDPTPARVSGLVEKIVNNVLLDGQLDECTLTLKDLNTIKERFSYVLNGILHKRIEYPGFDFNKNPGEKEGLKDKSIDKEPATKGKDRLVMDKTTFEPGLNFAEAKKK